jgi:hypothetical protein
MPMLLAYLVFPIITKTFQADEISIRSVVRSMDSVYIVVGWYGIS